MSAAEKAARPPLQAMLPALKPALIFECVGVPGLLQQVFEGAPRDATHRRGRRLHGDRHDPSRCSAS